MGLRIRHVVPRRGYLPDHLGQTRLGGLVIAALSIAQQQAETGHQVEIVGWSDGPRPARYQLGKVTAWRLPPWQWARFWRWDLSWLGPMWKHCLLHPPVDILHIHTAHTLLWLPKAKARVLHIHVPPPEKLPPDYRRLLKRVDALIACSDFIRQRFLQASGYPEERAFTVYNGVDPSLLRCVSREEERARWGIRADELAAVYAGAIVPEKGVLHLVEAVRVLSPQFPSLRLLVAGGARLWNKPADYEGMVRERATGLPIDFLGVVDRKDIMGLFSACDLVVLPSVWDEPMGMVACEAMAAGRPLVSSRVGGVPEIVEDGVTGLLVPPGNVAELVKAISRLISDPALRCSMGARGRQQATAFSWTAVSERVYHVYQTALPDERGTRCNGT